MFPELNSWSWCLSTHHLRCNGPKPTVKDLILRMQFCCTVRHAVYFLFPSIYSVKDIPKQCFLLLSHFFCARTWFLSPQQTLPSKEQKSASKKQQAAWHALLADRSPKCPGLFTANCWVYVFFFFFCLKICFTVCIMKNVFHREIYQHPLLLLEMMFNYLQFKVTASCCTLIKLKCRLSIGLQAVCVNVGRADDHQKLWCHPHGQHGSVGKPEWYGKKYVNAILSTMQQALDGVMNLFKRTILKCVRFNFDEEILRVEKASDSSNDQRPQLLSTVGLPNRPFPGRTNKESDAAIGTDTNKSFQRAWSGASNNQQNMNKKVL